MGSFFFRRKHNVIVAIKKNKNVVEAFDISVTK